MSEQLNNLQLEKRLARMLRNGSVAAVLALAVVIGLLGLYLRNELREQILSRDAHLLESIVALEHERLLEDPFSVPGDYRMLAVSASALRGVLAMAVYDRSGWINTAIPETVDSVRLADQKMSRIIESGTQIHYYPEIPLSTVFFDVLAEDDQAVSLVEALVPLIHVNGGFDGVVRFWIDGSSVQASFDALNRRLLLQGLLAWLVGSLLLLPIGLIGGRRLAQAASTLETRNRDLESANRELELAARSSAVGAISAHLMHGLRNPLAGLSAYLRTHGTADAREAAGRMDKLIRETLSVLKSEDRPDRGLDLSLGELEDVLRSRLYKDFLLREQEWVFAIEPMDRERILPSREANLALLVLQNLLSNASEASPRMSTIRVGCRLEASEAVFEVADEGCGIAQSIQLRLFEPGNSSKETGSGLGLAISRQLARAVGGDLYLNSTSEHGSRFTLKIPLNGNRND